MSCEYCEHRSIAYRHYRDDNGRDKYERVAEPIPYDDDMQFDPEPMLSWSEPGEVEWADRKRRRRAEEAAGWQGVGSCGRKVRFASRANAEEFAVAASLMWPGSRPQVAYECELCGG